MSNQRLRIAELAATRRGWSMRQVADAIGVEPQTVMYWNQGRTCPRVMTLVKLCQLFACQLHELIDPPLSYQDLLSEDSPYTLNPSPQAP